MFDDFLVVQILVIRSKYGKNLCYKFKFGLLRSKLVNFFCFSGQNFQVNGSTNDCSTYELDCTRLMTILMEEKVVVLSMVQMHEVYWTDGPLERM